jgi:dTDP-4-dehydrorhamnose reductase
LSGAADAQAPLQLWGGVECTVNRVRDRFFSQLERNGHATRLDDLERFAQLGIQALRYPALWELIAPDDLAGARWSWLDERLALLKARRIQPVLGLVHHGSGPHHTHLLDDNFAPGLAQYAGAVAQRYPWVRDYTPVNEPYTTARFSALYGVWYPHKRSDRAYVRALLNQCRATVLSMQAVRAVNPEARLVQTDDLGLTLATPAMQDVADFYNERRWLGWDLLCGRVDAGHPLHRYLVDSGAREAELAWFRDHPCPPDVIGINYYIPGERWLDERVERYPPAHRGGRPERPFADIEIARALVQPLQGVAPLLAQAWERYRLPLAVTEVHIDANREDQLRWIDEVWRPAAAVRPAGARVEAVTVWALLGTFDWNSLVTQPRGYYEPGAYDVRCTPPRQTAVAGLMRELAAGTTPSHPVLQHGSGWWRREGRFLCEPVEMAGAASGAPTAGTPRDMPQPVRSEAPRPLLLLGARGTLGTAFSTLCKQRDLSFVALSRPELDITDPVAVSAALARWRPWAVVNAGGYVRVDDAEHDEAACRRANVDGPALLSTLCHDAGIPLLGFSSDLVFDGRLDRPYVEHDEVSPLNAYGRSKADAERAMLAHPRSLIVRTSAFFGPWDDYNFLATGLQRLAQGEPVWAGDEVITPTYVPDLVHACLDLLVDGAAGLWHLSNAEAVSWHEFLRRAAHGSGLAHRAHLIHDTTAPGPRAARPRHSALGSVHEPLLPTLGDALHRYLRAREGSLACEHAPVAVRRIAA